jgi:DNA-binding CsgD family transcriptional regulator
MSDELGFNRAICDLYGAAISEGNWIDVAHQLESMLGATSSVLLVTDAKARITTPLGAHGWDERALADYQSYFWQIDLWLQAATTQLPASRAGMLTAFVPTNQWERSEIWNDYLKYNDKQFFCVGAWVPFNDSTKGVVGIHRVRQLGDFGATERRKMQAFLPHFRRALQVAHALGETRLTQQIALEALDALAVGLLLVDGSCRVLHVNRRAEQILSANDGLSRSAGGILSADIPGETRTLQRLVGEASSLFNSAAARGGGVMSISRASSSQPLAILVAPLPLDHAARLPAQPKALLLITDPAERTVPPEEFLRVLFGLTAAEAKLAIALGEGATVGELTDGFQITANTARSHIKRIFDKMSVHRQSELVAVLARLPVPPRSARGD